MTIQSEDKKTPEIRNPLEINKTGQKNDKSKDQTRRVEAGKKAAESHDHKSGQHSQTGSNKV